jgi:hypothetical protein
MFEYHHLSVVQDWLLYISSHPPYVEAVSSIRNLRARYAVVTMNPFLIGL